MAPRTLAATASYREAVRDDGDAERTEAQTALPAPVYARGKSLTESRPETTSVAWRDYSGVDQRQIARKLNVASEAEIERLVRQHRTLVDKKLGGVISNAELRELQMVRWHLDRIEDATVGPALDEVERIVEQQELFASTVERLAKVIDPKRR